MTEAADLLRVGQVIKPHGIDGELVVESYTDYPEERFRTGQELFLVEGDETIPVAVEEYRWHQDRILLTLEQVPDRDRAEELRDCWLVIPADEAFDDSEDVLSHEMVGLTVRDAEGEARGVVSDVHPDPMNPLAEITIEDEVLDFPLSEGLVLELDPDAGYIVLDFPTGWEKLKRD